MNPRCRFADYFCDREPDESGYCPRHFFLMAEMGKEAAESADGIFRDPVTKKVLFKISSRQSEIA